LCGTAARGFPATAQVGVFGVKVPSGKKCVTE